MSSTPALTFTRIVCSPADPGTRAIARPLYESVAELPIISPHGHVPAQWLADDTPFADPTSLLITPDHYVNRMLHAHGVPAVRARALGRARSTEAAVAGGVPHRLRPLGDYRGTPVRFWFDAQLADIFGVTVRPSAETADRIYDQIAECLAAPEFRPRALYDRFGIEVLATTDDPCDDLAAHRVPARRPDLDRPGDPDLPARPVPGAGHCRPGMLTSTGSAEVGGIDTGDYSRLPRRPGGPPPLLQGPRRGLHRPQPRRRPHRRAGAVPRPSASTRWPGSGEVTEAEATALRRHLVSEMARMACDDGLVMTLHPGVRRNHHLPTFETYGSRRRHRHPDPGRVHRRAPSAAEPLRHPPELPVDHLHPRRDRLLHRDRPAGRVLSRRSTPGHRGGSSTRPRRSAATARRSPSRPVSPRPPASSTTPAPSAPSRPGTTCRVASTPASSPRWSPSTGSTRTRRSRPCTTSSSPIREGRSSCEHRNHPG